LKKAERRQAGLSSESDSSDEDPDKQTGTQEEFVSKDPKVRTAVLNLRQREDVAKYLRNLDPKSAAYDGKSRMMKENPNPDLPDDLQLFKGDNFVKFTGDALNLLQ
jgi:pre-mRNA-processing factor SLU7